MGACCTTDTAIPENAINIERRPQPEGNQSALLDDQDLQQLDTSLLGNEIKEMDLLSPLDSNTTNKKQKPMSNNKDHNINSIKSDGSIIRERSDVFTFQDSNGVIMLNPGGNPIQNQESVASMELGNPKISAIKNDISAYSEQIHSDLEIRTDDDFDDIDGSDMIVIDNGSDTLKIGFSGGSETHFPSKTFPSIIGQPKHSQNVHLDAMSSHDLYFGQDAYSKAPILDISNVIKRGQVVDWDWMELLYDYAFHKQLTIPQNRGLEDYNVLLTESVHSNDSEREKYFQLMFETYGVNSVFLANTACLSLYGAGKVTGTVLGIGYGLTYSAGIYEGSCIPQSVIKCLSAGCDITNYLKQILSEKFDRILKNVKQSTFRDMKEKCCFVADGCATNEMYKRHKVEPNGTTRISLSFKKYKLPDGKVIRIGSERSRAPEKLFGGFMNLNPEFDAVNDSGIHHMINESIMSVRVKDVEDELYQNIVLSGGSTLLDGLPKRLKVEMKKLTEDKKEINIIAPDRRECLAWIGGSILSSLSNHRQNFILKGEYEEEGPSVHKRCPK